MTLREIIEKQFRNKGIKLEELLEEYEEEDKH
jgi:hypothetical protein